MSDVDCSNNNLESLNIKNGSNNLIDEFFNASGNPNLTCIQVDDVEYSTNTWTNIDPQTSFSELCDFEILVFNKDSQQKYTELKMGGLSIAADGSTSTVFKYTGNDNENIILQFKEQLTSNPGVYGDFQAGEIKGDTLEIKFGHPKYFAEPNSEFPNPQNKLLTLQVKNGSTGGILIEYPIKIVRPSLLFVHGIWSSGQNAFGKMELEFLQDGMYKNYQTHKVNYHAINFNKANIPIYKAQKEQLKNKAIENNISFGKIDIVAHSNGGLMSRHYIQSGDFLDDVNKFMTLNTPHSGTQVANLLLSSGATGTTLNVFLEVISPLMGTNPNFGIISDLRVDENDSEEFYITWLNDTNSQNMQNYNNIAVHTLTTTSQPEEVDISEIYYDINPPFGTFLLYSGFDLTQDLIFSRIFQSPDHDLYVPLESQKGGSIATTNFPNIKHTDSTDDLISEVRTLLNSDPQVSFSDKGFSPTVLETDFDSEASTPLRQNSSKVIENVSIVLPTQGMEYSSGEIMEIEISGSAGILNILTISGTPDNILQSTSLENTNAGTVQFTIPEGFLGKYNIVCAGFDENGYADYDASFINVTTNASLESINIAQERIFVVEGYENRITILGNYNDGETRNITNVEAIEYSFEQNNAEFAGLGNVTGVNEGEDTLTVSYLGKLATVPITIFEAIDSGGVPLSIVDNQMLVEPLVYPNPTEKILHVEINQESSYSIIDIFGKTIKTGMVENGNNELNLKNYRTGLYFLRLRNDSGTLVKKVLKR